MGSAPTSDLEVLVADVGVDAALVELGSEKLLMIRPHMSFGAAVEAVVGVCPGMGADDAARIVRRALPGAVNLDDRFAFAGAECVCAPAATPRPVEAPGRLRRSRWRRHVVGSLSVALLLTSGYAVGLRSHHHTVGSELEAMQETITALHASDVTGLTPEVVDQLAPRGNTASTQNRQVQNVGTLSVAEKKERRKERRQKRRARDRAADVAGQSQAPARQPQEVDDIVVEVAQPRPVVKPVEDAVEPAATEPVGGVVATVTAPVGDTAAGVVGEKGDVLTGSTLTGAQ